MSVHDRTAPPACLALALDVVASAAHCPADAQGKPGDPSSKLEYEGWQAYTVNCARGHRRDAAGGRP